MYYTFLALLTAIISVVFSCFGLIEKKAKEILGLQSEKRTFAVFVCGPDPTQDITKASSRNLRGKTYVDLLKLDDPKCAENEEWKEYMIYQNKFPTQEELLSFTGVIITGSKHDSYTNDAEWKLKLQEMIRNIYHHNNKNKNKIKLFGVCFGHQMIIHSLRDINDGKAVVGLNPKRKSIELGLVKIDVNDKFYKFWNRYNVKIDHKSLYIHQAHNDAVFELPSYLKDAEVLASSTYTDIEMYHIGNYILGVQGHPEFTTEYLSNAVKKNKKYLKFTDSQVHDVLETMQLNKPNIDEWKYMFTTWLRA